MELLPGKKWCFPGHLSLPRGSGKGFLPGGSGQCAGSAPGAGRSQAAGVGVPVGRGWGEMEATLEITSYPPHSPGTAMITQCYLPSNHLSVLRQ